MKKVSHSMTKLSVLGALLLPLGLAQANISAESAPVYSSNITEQEVLAAQKAWGEALVKISKDFEEGGRAKAKETALNVLNAAYGYDLGPVLFKPTLTTAPQTFRTTKDGALAYFVGGDKNFPNDSGFALKGWRKVDVKNAALQLHGPKAVSMGNVTLVDKTGKVTVVDKTWGYLKDPNGQVKIVLHHSSLPYSPK